ncbi:MAG: hypothetical protein AB7P02_31030 [Alphaproteobacteria bacterium]
MRVLAVIPHYFAGSPDGKHGSERADAADQRAAALSAAICGLRQNLGAKQWRANVRRLTGESVTGADGEPVQRGELHCSMANVPHRAAALDIVVVTTAGRHLAGRLGHLPQGWFETVSVDVPPRQLGFACQDVLAARAEGYDWLCYLEDDVIVSDPLFLTKVAFVETETGGEAVLMPNRFELLLGRHIEKLYVDGPHSHGFTAAWQDVSMHRRFHIRLLNSVVEIERATNPHAGCFFISARQFARWRSKPWFGSRDSSFVGPLESAATLGLMKTFRLYKPAVACAGFLEAEHRNNRKWLGFDP